MDCAGQSSSCLATVTAAQPQVGLDLVNPRGSNRESTSLAAVGRSDFNYAAKHPDPGNPEYMPGDANPFGLTTGPGGGFYVIDAASNTLDLVTATVHVSVLALVPDPPHHRPIYDAAPTCAARTPNGDVLIATESNSLWRWHGGHLTRVLAGGKLGQVVGLRR